MKGILLEGVPSVGKSTVLGFLRRHPALAQAPSLLVLADHYTELAAGRVGRRLQRRERLLYRVLGALEPLRVLSVEAPIFAENDILQLRFVLEGFHLAVAAGYGDSDRNVFDRIEKALLPYHPLLVLLRAGRETYAERLREALEERPEEVTRRMARLGDSFDAMLTEGLALQDRFLELFAVSRLETLLIDLDQTALDEAAAMLAAWLVPHYARGEES